MVPEAHRLHGCFRVSWPVVGEGMERKHSAAIETVLERHKCPGLSSNLGGMGRALADRSILHAVLHSQTNKQTNIKIEYLED